MLLIISLTAASLLGGRPERLAALTLILTIVIDNARHMILGSADFSQIDKVHFLLDGAILGVALWLVHKANRVWPIFIAAIQAFPVLAHITMTLGVPGIKGAYWALSTLPVYPLTLTILLGAITQQRRLRRLGPYPELFVSLGDRS